MVHNVFVLFFFGQKRNEKNERRVELYAEEDLWEF